MEETITKEWFTSWFDSKYYDLLYKGRNQGEADVFINNLVTFLKPAAGSFMLDLACGKGRHAISLSKLGYYTTGIDISEPSIYAAEQLAGKNLEFYIHDMRKPFTVNYYNYVFNLFTSFGYFNTDRENHMVLANIYNALKPGGTFVLDFANINKCVQTFSPFEEKEVNGIKFTVQKQIQGNFLLKNIHVTDNEKESDYTEQIRMFTPDELTAMIEKQGFTVVKTFGDYNLSTFAPATSDRFILISKKK